MPCWGIRGSRAKYTMGFGSHFLFIANQTERAGVWAERRKGRQRACGLDAASELERGGGLGELVGDAVVEAFDLEDQRQDREASEPLEHVSGDCHGFVVDEDKVAAVVVGGVDDALELRDLDLDGVVAPPDVDDLVVEFGKDLLLLRLWINDDLG